MLSYCLDERDRRMIQEVIQNGWKTEYDTPDNNHDCHSLDILLKAVHYNLIKFEKLQSGTSYGYISSRMCYRITSNEYIFEFSESKYSGQFRIYAIVERRETRKFFFFKGEPVIQTELIFSNGAWKRGIAEEAKQHLKITIEMLEAAIEPLEKLEKETQDDKNREYELERIRKEAIRNAMLRTYEPTNILKD